MQCTRLTASEDSRMLLNDQDVMLQIACRGSELMHEPHKTMHSAPNTNFVDKVA